MEDVHIKFFLFLFLMSALCGVVKMGGRAGKGENVGLDRRGLRMMSQESFVGERVRFFEHSMPRLCAGASPLSP